MKTIIKIETEAEREIELVFNTGNYTTPNFIDMIVGNDVFCVDVEELMDALIPFHAKISRDKDN